MLNKGSYNCVHWSGYKKYTYNTQIFSEHSLHTAHCLITIFFALENFNLLLSSNDPITSHLKHPNQTPIPSAPFKDVGAETFLCLQSILSHLFSLEPLKESMKYGKSAGLFPLYRWDPERPTWLKLVLRTVLRLAPSHLSPNSYSLLFSRLPQTTCHLYIPSIAFLNDKRCPILNFDFGTI